MQEKTINHADCEVCEMAIIAGTAKLDEAVQQHLQSCPACQEFARWQDSLLALPPEEHETPSFASIIQENHRRKREQRKLRLIALPLSIAAAAALAVGGIIFQLPPHTVPGNENDYQLLNDPTLFAAALEESSVLLAWDQATLHEQQCIDSMRAAQDGSKAWSIELFNPYSEE